MVVVSKLHRDFGRVFFSGILTVVLLTITFDPFGDFKFETATLSSIIVVLFDVYRTGHEVNSRLIFTFFVLV